MMLEQLKEKNKVPIFDVCDDEFKSYGRIVTGYDCSELIRFMEQETTVPEEGNIYVPSVAAMEESAIKQQLEDILYGGMPIQIGYCNGQNSTWNGFEYHKGSEINIAVTDFMLILGHRWEIKNNTYQSADAKVFFVRCGTAIEMYQTTLHLSPCKVRDEGFKDIVILPRGTNLPLAYKPAGPDEESRLLLHTNKWVLAHPDREPLIRQGAYPGLLGENIKLNY